MSERPSAGAVLSLVDQERPNQYPASRKLEWLRELDGLAYEELLKTHAAACEPPDERYGEDTRLLLPFPYAQPLYRAWLFTQIDLSNGDILRYNQSLALLEWLWRRCADFLNRASLPRGGDGWRL